MFETVLVPTDFSQYALRVPECVAQIPGVKNIVLLNVVARDPLARTWDPVAEMRDAKRKLDDQARTLKLPGINIKTREELNLEGTVPTVVKMVAKEEGASLIAMGARGKGAFQFKDMLMGSVTKGVLKYADIDLLIMRYKMLGQSDLTNFCSTLVVSSGETKEQVDMKAQEASNAIKAMAESQGVKGLNVNPVVAVGNPVREINSVAEKENVSLIVLSAIGGNAPSRAMIGSIAYDVANNAERPVLIVR